MPLSNRQRLVHAVTDFDRKQEAKAAANPKAHYNVYALPQYLGRASDVADDIDTGASIEAAICAGFTPGPLRTRVLKEFGLGSNQSQVSGSYKGMPVYIPASSAVAKP